MKPIEKSSKRRVNKRLTKAIYFYFCNKQFIANVHLMVQSGKKITFSIKSFFQKDFILDEGNFKNKISVIKLISVINI